MKNILLFVFIMGSFSMYSQNISKTSDGGTPDSYTVVGKKFSSQNLLTSVQMQENYADLKAGDTVEVSFRGQVASVCQSKGCWMTMNLKNGKEVMVKFKDYAFFVPKDISGKEVILHGKAYVTETSVEEQRHYAEDAGKSKTEIAGITKPSLTLSFLADGVKIRK